MKTYDSIETYGIGSAYSEFMNKHSLETGKIYDTGLTAVELSDFEAYMVHEKDNEGNWTGNLRYEFEDFLRYGGKYSEFRWEFRHLLEEAIEDYYEENGKIKFSTLMTKEVRNNAGWYAKIDKTIMTKYVNKCAEVFGKLNSTKKVIFEFYNSDINWRPGSFGNNGSCYWGCYASARHALDDLFSRNWGFAVRFYSTNGEPIVKCSDPNYPDLYGYGRMLAIFYRNCPVSFNVYPSGTLFKTYMDNMAKLTGLVWKEISLDGEDDTFYINSDKGYLLYNPETDLWAEDLSSLEIDCSDFDNNRVHCDHCGDRISENDDSYTGPNGETLCEYCYNENCWYCNHCDETYYSNRTEQVQIEVTHRYYSGNYTETEYVCPDCARSMGYEECEICGSYCQDCAETENYYHVCPDCIERQGLEYCEECEQYCRNCVTRANGDKICPNCADSLDLHICSKCEHEITDEGDWNSLKSTCYPCEQGEARVSLPGMSEFLE